MATDADVLAQGRREVVRRQHVTMVVGLFWGALVLALLTAWLYVRHWTETSPVVLGSAVLTLIVLALAGLQLRAGLLARRDPAHTEDTLRPLRRPTTYILAAVAAVLLLLLIWLATQEGLPASFPEFISGVVLALIGLGAGGLLLLEPGAALDQEAFLRALAGRRGLLQGALVVAGVVLIVAGILTWVNEGLQAAFPEVAGAFLLALVLLGGAAYLFGSTGADLPPNHLRMLILAVGGLAGLVVALTTILRAVLWWNEVFAPGIGAWRGEGGWRLWVCFYVELLGLALIFGSLTLGRADIRVNPTLRRLLFGYNTILTGLLLLAVLVVCNVTVYACYPYTFEWTKGRGLYSLSDKSKSTLEALKEPVTIYVLMADRSADFGDVRTLLQNVQTFTNRVRVEYVSPDLQIERYGALVKRFPDLGAEKQEAVPGRRPGGARGLLVVYGLDTGKTPPPHAFIPASSLSGESQDREGFFHAFQGEDRLMTELRYLARGSVRPAVYFTQGNGELDIADKRTRLGTGLFAEVLRSQRYEVRGLVWGPPPGGKAPPGGTLVYSQKEPGAAHEMPKDAMAVIIAQPGAPYAKGALDALGKYLDGKGKLLFLSNLLIDENDFSLRKTGLEDFLPKYGVELGNGYVLCVPLPGQPGSPTSAKAKAPPESSNRLARRFERFSFPIGDARTVQAAAGGGAFQVETILEVRSPPNPPAFWSETDLKTLRNPPAYVNFLLQDQQRLLAKMSREPLPVGVAVADRAGKPKLIAFGDATMISNDIVNYPNVPYLQLMVSSLEWLAGRPENIGIEPRKTNFFMFRRDVSLASVGLLPTGLVLLGLVGLGAGVWVVRRR